MEDNNNNKKRYFANIAGVRVEISKEKAEQIRRLQRIIKENWARQQADKGTSNNN